MIMDAVQIQDWIAPGFVLKMLYWTTWSHLLFFYIYKMLLLFRVVSL